MYVKVTNGTVDQFPYTIGQLRRDNPNTSFPKVIPSATLESFGIYEVTFESAGDYNERTQSFSHADTPTLENGVWTVACSIVDKSAEVIATDTENQSARTREKRDLLLAETDYLALSDSTLSSEMTAYRQALRDITSHANFPNLEDADWPTKP